MSTFNRQFYDKMTKFPQIFVLLIYRKNLVGTKKRVRISHGKRAIGIRAIEVRLYIVMGSLFLLKWIKEYIVSQSVHLPFLAPSSSFLINK